MGALTTEEALREEEAQFLPDEREKGLTALCLSGGGIRSGAFALGIIQALATHPRPSEHERVEKADDSLLAKFHYLSTVSGGGYIGCWLSAWIHRTGFYSVWAGLTGATQDFDAKESLESGAALKHTKRNSTSRDIGPEAPVAWLRSYSNYLTPKLGIMSADTWAAIALFVRNMLLNWLVIIPPLCAVLLIVKLFALAMFAMHHASFGQIPLKIWDRPVPPFWNIEISDFTLLLFAAGVLALIFGLQSALANRPTNFDEDEYRKISRDASTEGPSRQRNEKKEDCQAPGVDEIGFLWQVVFPILVAAVILTLWISARECEVCRWTTGETIAKGALAGFCVYLVTFIVFRMRIGIAARLPTWLAARFRDRFSIRLWNSKFWWDCIAWVAAGAVFGVCVGLGMRVLFAVKLPELGRQSSIYFLIIAGVPWFLISQLTAEMIFVGLTSKQPRSDQDREWFGRSGGWLAAAGFGWLVFVSLVVIGPKLVVELIKLDWSGVGATVGSISGVISAVLGHSSATKVRNAEQGWLGLSLNVVLAVTVPVFLGSLIIGLSAWLDRLLIGGSPFERWTGIFGLSTLWCLVVGLGAAVVISFATSGFVNINWFSLHGLYRNRLIRAFLGASNAERLPNPFTGFDQKDNPQVAELWRLRSASDQEDNPSVAELCRPGRGCWQPFHVINVALNLVSSKRLAWQERKAASFTISPLHCGWACDDKPRFRRTGEYGHSKEGISLGTAMAISGAAASPNMGYHSSPLVSLILALFNVRLGWWLGNPGERGERTFWGSGNIPASKMESPRWALRPFFNELFGLTSEDRPFVYLSDGGHFENLGLYEMVRRRCKYIVVSDASCDPDFAFEDLGNAVRKIWIDLGVKINFYGIQMLRSRMEKDQRERLSGSGTRPSAQDDDSPLFAIGRIEYDTASLGYILYVKAAYNRSALRNVGVRSYAMAHSAFPHESTMDQFFSESQFESYRALGFEIMDDILLDGRAWSGAPVTLNTIIENLSKDVIKSYEADKIQVH